MKTSGVLIKSARMNSKWGGTVHKCTILCEDGVERTLWADPKMANFRQWEELVDTIDTELMRGRGIVLDNLKILVKKRELVKDKLDADVTPEVLDIVKLDEVLPQEKR